MKPKIWLNDDAAYLTASDDWNVLGQDKLIHSCLYRCGAEPDMKSGPGLGQKVDGKGAAAHLVEVHSASKDDLRPVIIGRKRSTHLSFGAAG